ncbi:MAG: M50 family metallopeptidase [Actinomycetes bacterium]
MATTVGIVAFVVALLLSVMVHEFGHYAFATRYGMKATEFFVGFGPRVWSFRRGETEYGIKAIPAGGYVKILGMTPLEELDPADRPRAYYRQPWWQRVVTTGAGVVINFIVSIVLIYVALVAIGLPSSNVSTKIANVSACIPTATAVSAEPACGPSDPPSPAKAAGLQAGDRIVAFDGKPVTSWEQLSREIRANGAASVPIVVERDGKRVTLTLQPVIRERPKLDDPKQTAKVGVVGISPVEVTTVQRVGPIEGVGRTASLIGQGVTGGLKALGSIPSAIPQLVKATFDGGQRDPNGLTGPVGVARISGEVASLSEVPVAARVSQFLLIVASLNLILGLLNVLPLLPFDGGHMAIAAYEGAKRRLWRRLGRDEPGPVDVAKLLPATYVVFALLVGLSLLLLAADIVNPVKLFQ